VSEAKEGGRVEEDRDQLVTVRGVQGRTE